MKSNETENENILAIVERLNGNELVSEDELTSLIRLTTIECKVPQLPNADIPYTAEDFDGVARKAEVHLSIIIKILDYIHQEKEKSSRFSPTFLRNASVCCFLAACEFTEEQWEWNDPRTAQVSMKVIEKIHKLHGCSSVKEFLTCNARLNCDMNIEGGFIKHILQRLSEVLIKSSWRCFPGLKMSYWRILHYLDVSVYTIV